MPTQPTQENLALFRELGKDSKSALTRIYKLYSASLMSTSFQILKDRELAEEVIMDIFLSLWEKRAIVSMMENPAGWLFKCVYYKSLNELKRKKIQRTFPITDQSGPVTTENVEASIEMQEFSRIVQLEMEKLPPRQKKILQLRMHSGMSRKEIARLYKISESTVKKQINSAYKNLRKAMKKLTG